MKSKFKVGDIVVAKRTSMLNTVVQGNLYKIQSIENNFLGLVFKDIKSGNTFNWDASIFELAKDLTDIEKALYGIKDV